jgi:light-regulated signal transduction histidine kinase (bacteriophytochrome)
LPWKQVEVKATLELRKAIVNIVLQQAEELRYWLKIWNARTPN